MNFNNYFEYQDGQLYWKNCRYKAYNGKKAGHVHKTGYWRIKLNKENYQAHRIIFAMHHGFMPEFIDHIDGNRSNNKIENLRQATKQQNNWNRAIQKNNSSGIKGISWREDCKKWIACCRVNYKLVYLGLFNEIEEAKKVLSEFRSKNHGNFAKN
jgi:hypothetical protein